MPKLPPDKAKSIDENEGGFPLLDEGIYVGTLNDVTEKIGPNGPYWAWRFGDLFSAYEEDWQDPSYAPGNQWLNVSLGDSSEWKMQEVFTAFGVPADTDTDDLIGEKVRLVVSQRIIEKGPKKGQLTNSIDQVLPLYDEAAEGEAEPEPEPEPKPKAKPKARTGAKR